MLAPKAKEINSLGSFLKWDHPHFVSMFLHLPCPSYLLWTPNANQACFGMYSAFRDHWLDPTVVVSYTQLVAVVEMWLKKFGDHLALTSHWLEHAVVISSY